jgi:hypothetical protein
VIPTMTTLQMTRAIEDLRCAAVQAGNVASLADPAWNAPGPLPKGVEVTDADDRGRLYLIGHFERGSVWVTALDGPGMFWIYRAKLIDAALCRGGHVDVPEAWPRRVKNRVAQERARYLGGSG